MLIRNSLSAWLVCRNTSKGTLRAYSSTHSFTMSFVFAAFFEGFNSSLKVFACAWVGARMVSRKQWSEFGEDVVVVVKRIETFEHKRIRINTMSTVGEFKKQAHQKWNDIQENQRFIFGLEVLDDDCKLIGLYDIADGSVVHMGWDTKRRCLRMNRLIVKNNISCFVVMWNVSDSIEFVRGRIASKFTIHACNIELSCDGMQLQDNRTIHSYNIAHDSTVQLTVRPAWPTASSRDAVGPLARASDLEQALEFRQRCDDDHANDALTLSTVVNSCLSDGVSGSQV